MYVQLLLSHFLVPAAEEYDKNSFCLATDDDLKDVCRARGPLLQLRHLRDKLKESIDVNCHLNNTIYEFSLSHYYCTPCRARLQFHHQSTTLGQPLPATQ